MNRKRICIAGLALALSSVVAVAQDASARTVQYHSQDIVPMGGDIAQAKPPRHCQSLHVEAVSRLDPLILSAMLEHIPDAVRCSQCQRHTPVELCAIPIHLGEC